MNLALDNAEETKKLRLELRLKQLEKVEACHQEGSVALIRQRAGAKLNSALSGQARSVDSQIFHCSMRVRERGRGSVLPISRLDPVAEFDAEGLNDANTSHRRL